MSTPRFCSHCGKPLAAGARFCGQCGHPVQAVPASPTATPEAPAYAAPPPPPTYQAPPPPPVQPAPAAPPVQAEPIVTIIPGLNHHRGFMGLGVDTYTLVLTPGRMVFVKLDTNTMKTLVEEARQRAKAQGKGAMGQWVAQMGWVNVHIEHLQAMAPATMLAQFPGSFFVANNAVSKARVKRVSSGSYDDNTPDRTELHLDTTGGKYKFVLGGTGMSAKELKQRLQQTLGAVVR